MDKIPGRVVYVVQYDSEGDWASDPPKAETCSTLAWETDKPLGGFDPEEELARSLKDVPSCTPTPRTSTIHVGKRRLERPAEELIGLELFPRDKRMLEPSDMFFFTEATEPRMTHKPKPYPEATHAHVMKMRRQAAANVWAVIVGAH